MFQVRVSVVLLGSDGWAALSRELSLPFVPFPGLDLLNISARPDLPDTVAEVAWNEAEECFEVELLSDNSGTSTLDELLAEYGPEWEREEQEPGFLRVV